MPISLPLPLGRRGTTAQPPLARPPPVSKKTGGNLWLGGSLVPRSWHPPGSKKRSGTSGWGGSLDPPSPGSPGGLRSWSLMASASLGRGRSLDGCVCVIVEVCVSGCVLNAMDGWMDCASFFGLTDYSSATFFNKQVQHKPVPSTRRRLMGRSRVRHGSHNPRRLIFCTAVLRNSIAALRPARSIGKTSVVEPGFSFWCPQ